MIASDPLASTYNTPIYSNGGVQILAYAMEKITKMSYADAFNAALGQPLGLNRTFLSQPRNNDNAIIPFSQSTSFWDVNLGDGTP
jgi:CubicO group peptidase (beta-lactamase class C family)